MRLHFSALEIAGCLLDIERELTEPVVIFQAAAYTVVNTGSTNSSQVGRTLIGPDLLGRRCARRNPPRQPFCACATARPEFETVKRRDLRWLPTRR